MQYILIIVICLWFISSYLYRTSTFKEDNTEHLDYLRQQLKEKQYEARTDEPFYKETIKPKTKPIYSGPIQTVFDFFVTKKLMYISAKDKALYLQSKEWKELKLFRLKIAQHKCECCGSTYYLQLHHITYIRLTKEKIGDVAILCKICHQKIHYKLGYDRATKYPISSIKD
jgi:hypothetical protein